MKLCSAKFYSMLIPGFNEIRAFAVKRFADAKSDRDAEMHLFWS